MDATDDDESNNFETPLYHTWYIVSFVLCAWGVVGHVTVATLILTDKQYVGGGGVGRCS